MHGKILEVGVILGEDGSKYTFEKSELKNKGELNESETVGRKVNFFARRDDTASEIFLISEDTCALSVEIEESEFGKLRWFGLGGALCWIVIIALSLVDFSFVGDSSVGDMVAGGLTLALMGTAFFLFYKTNKTIDKFANSHLVQNLKRSFATSAISVVLIYTASLISVYVFDKNNEIRYDAEVVNIVLFAVLGLTAFLLFLFSLWCCFKLCRELRIVSHDGLFMLAFAFSIISVPLTWWLGWMGFLSCALPPLCVGVAFYRLKGIWRIKEEVEGLPRANS